MEIRSVAVAAEVAVAAVAVVVGGGGAARVALAARVVSVKEQLCSWSPKSLCDKVNKCAYIGAICVCYFQFCDT